MLKASGFADTGKITEAIIVLEAFISSYPVSELCTIAEGEIESYKGARI